MLKHLYPWERTTSVLIAQEAILGVFREETPFCLCRDAIPRIFQPAAYDFQTVRHSVLFYVY
jgi:hypothetical protein